MTRPRRDAHADPGSDPDWEWEPTPLPHWCDRDPYGHTTPNDCGQHCAAVRAEITD